MLYNVDADIVLGSWPEVWIPATVGSMQVHSVVDGNGQSHSFYMDSGYIKVRGFDMRPGDHVTLYINSTLPGFVYKSDKPGYDIVSFTPPWWDMTITDTMVKYVLPAEINVSEVFTGKREYSGIGTENNRTMVFFNSSSLSCNEQFDTAVSFPDRYMAAGAVTSSGSIVRRRHPHARRHRRRDGQHLRLYPPAAYRHLHSDSSSSSSSRPSSAAPTPRRR